MALKDTWKDLENVIEGVPESGEMASADDINKIAHAVIDIEKNGVSDGQNGEPYAYVFTVDEEGNLYCEYAGLEDAPFVYDDETGYLYYVTENSTKTEILDVNFIVRRVVDQLSGGTTTYNLMSVDNEVGTQDLTVTDSVTGAAVLTMAFARSEDNTATIMTVGNIKGDTVKITIQDGKDYVLTETDKEEIANKVKELIPLSDYVKTVNGTMPDDNGNVVVSMEPPPSASSIEWLEQKGDITKQYVLPDGYLYAYMDKLFPTRYSRKFTNQIPISQDLDGNVFNGTGYQNTSRLSAKGVVWNPDNPDGAEDYMGSSITGFIPIESGQVIYLNEEALIQVMGKSSFNTLLYAEDRNTILAYFSCNDLKNNTYPESFSEVSYADFILPDGVNKASRLVSFRINNVNAKFIRFTISKGDISVNTDSYLTSLSQEKAVISINNPIEYEEIPSGYYGVWASTEQKYGNDYSAEIADLTNRVKALENAEDEIAIAISNPFIKSINHRGYHPEGGATENTLQAYKDSKKIGFEYVETDVQFTSDNIPVLYHNSYIGSNTTDYLWNYTYEELYEKIPTITKYEDFILLCRNLGLHPYIELKNAGLSTEHAQILFDICKKYNMHRNCTWISFYANSLTTIKNIDSNARIGYIPADGITQSNIDIANGLKTDSNEVFINAYHTEASDETKVNLCIAADLPLEVWTVNSLADAENLHPYVSGFTSDSVIIGTELLKKNLKEEV